MSNIVYKLNNEKTNNLPIRLLYTSKAIYEDDWHKIMHMHPFTEIFYITGGQGVFKFEDKEVDVSVDDLVIVNPNVNHTELSTHEDPLEFIVFAFDGMSIIFDDKSKVDTKDIYRYSIHNYKDYKKEVLFLIDLIINELKKKEEEYESICQSLLQVLILNIIRNTNSKLTLSAPKDVNKECDYVQKYIDLHYATDISLDYLASIVFMNKYYLIHEFKKHIGTSPIEYLINKRIYMSKILIETTDYSMEQISKSVGFNSQSYFNQIFKKRVGKTPTLFKRELEKPKK